MKAAGRCGLEGAAGICNCQYTKLGRAGVLDLLPVFLCLNAGFSVEFYDGIRLIDLRCPLMKAWGGARNVHKIRPVAILDGVRDRPGISERPHISDISRHTHQGAARSRCFDVPIGRASAALLRQATE